MFYPLLRKLLFTLEPERAHALTLQALTQLQRCGLSALMAADATLAEPVDLMGLRFANRVAIAAGLDKNAVCVDALGALGVGAIEVGTVTPQPQAGNPKPRLFRLPEAGALINRMGFPNDGMQVIAQRLTQARFNGVRGVNIGKNASTRLEEATRDYVTCMQYLAPHADYIAINVSSPNTVGLRNLQAAEQLRPLLNELLEQRARLLSSRGKALPLLVKLAPDLDDEQLQDVARLLLELAIDGVIATNTTLTRPGSLGPLANETGGLSGRPVHQLALTAIRKLRGLLGAGFPIIGVGGICSGADALAMRQAGADIVQIYTGLIYRGPALITEVLRALQTSNLKSRGYQGGQ